MYNKDKMNVPDSWAAFWDPRNRGYVATFDDSSLNIPIVALYAGIKDPFNLDESGFEKVRAALVELRGQLKTIVRGGDEMEALFSSGDAYVGYCQLLPSIFRLQDKGLPVYPAYPKEGTLAWVDNVVVTPNGKERDEVYAFLNTVLSPPWQARFMQFAGQNGVITVEEAIANGVTKDVLARTETKDASNPEFLKRLIVLQKAEDYDRRLSLWNDFKAGTL